MKKNGTKGNRRSKVKVLLCVMVFLIACLYARKCIFAYGTTINGIDCSLLSKKAVIKKLEEETEKKIVFIYVDWNGETKKVWTSYEELEKLEIKVSSDAVESAFDTQQEDRTQKEFNLSDLYSVNKEALRNFLEEISELTYSTSPKNAYLKLNEEGILEIVPEVAGNEVDFEEVVEYAKNMIAVGNKEIDFSSITICNAEITADNETLLQNQEEVNAILQTVINFTLSDGEIVTLDSNTMKEWVEVDESNKLVVNIQDNIEEFVNYLANKVENATQTIAFETTSDSNIVFFTLDDTRRVCLDEENEIIEIMKCLDKGGTYDVEPLYEGSLASNLLSDYELIENGSSYYFLTHADTYIELDIDRQTVWLYIDGECMLESECVTGNVSEGCDTPTGIYFLTYKATDATLRGENSDGSTYASFVKYWMPFNGGIGFHDASWRSKFGGTIYKTNGSHGCVNMPTDAACTLYEYINTEIPIIVHSS